MTARATLVAIACLAAPVAFAVADAAKVVHVKAGPLVDALEDLAKQCGVDVVYPSAQLREFRTRGVSGTLEPREAFERLIAGTPLILRQDGSSLLIALPSKPYGALPSSSGSEASENIADEGKEGKSHSSDGFRVAQAGLGAGAGSASLGAQVERESNPESQALDEIVVTAQRREERLQNVPISVSVYTQGAMDVQGTRSIDDIARLTPAVQFTHGATNNNAESSDISIRGISSQAGAATTGIYIDDTPIQTRHLSFGSFNAYPALFDIERVEVLRGPQGTLFGSGSEGGTVRFITPEPSLSQSSVYARSEAGVTEHGDPLYEAGVAGGTPLVSERLGLRASLSYRHEGGFVDRIDWHTGAVAEKAANAGRTVTGRIALKWAVADEVTLTPSIYYQKRDIDDTSAWWFIRPDLAPGDPTGGQFNAPWRTGNELASPDSDRFVLAALKAQWSLGPIELFSSTSYFKRNQQATTDYSQFDRGIFLGNPFPPGGEIGRGYWVDEQKNWTQELRAESADRQARVSWTVGLFYQHARETTRQDVYDPSIQLDLGLPAQFNGGYIYQEDPRFGVDRQIAVFGQADVKLTDPLKLTLGLRYARAQFDGEANYPTTLVTGPGFVSRGSEVEHPVTPKVGLSYQIDADNLVYVTAAKGFRIGGANPAVGQFCYGAGGALASIGLADVPSTYGSDHVWSYEVGSKNLLASNRVLLNASAYYIDWKNIQQNVPLTACGFQYTGNIGTARSTGFDVQSIVNLSRAVSLGASFGYTDARFTRTVQLAADVFSIARDGDHLPASPWTATAFAQGSTGFLGRTAYARADYQYSARQTNTVAASNSLNGGFPAGFDPIPAQSFTSIRAGLKWSEWDFSIYAQNLMNSHPRLGGAAEIFAPYSLYTAYSYRPRTVGLTGTYRY